MRAAQIRDGAQRLRGNVPGDDDGRNFAMEFLSQLRDDLDAIRPIGKVEVSDDCPSSNGLRQLAARFKGGCGSSEG